MATTADDRLPTGLKAGWGFGSVGTLTVLNAQSLLLLFFFTAVLGMPPALAGTLLFGAKLFDAVAAPILGSMSDRTHSRFGRRRPYLFAGALVSALALAVIFNPPLALEGDALTLYVIAGLLLLALGYTLFNVPYIAMPAEMTDSPTERTALMSWRVAFVSVGQLVAVLSTLLIPLLGGGRAGYGSVGIILAAAVLVSMLVAFRASRRARRTEPTTTRMSARERWAMALRNRPFLLLIAAKICQLFGLASLSASLLFFVTAVLGGDERLAAAYGLAASAATIASMPLWVKAGRRHGKRNIYILGCAGFALVTLTWLFSAQGEPLALILLRGAAAGLFAGGLLLMGQSILPDTIDYDRRRSGISREGVFAGAYSFVEKASMALGPLVVGVILQLFGFAPAGGGSGPQTEGALTGVYIGQAVLPAAAYLLSIVPLLFYDLTEEKLRATGPLEHVPAPGIGPALVSRS